MKELIWDSLLTFFVVGLFVYLVMLLAASLPRIAGGPVEHDVVISADHPVFQQMYEAEQAQLDEERHLDEAEGRQR